MNCKELLAGYRPAPSDADVAREVARIEELSVRNRTLEVWAKCLASMDLTTLETGDSDRSVGEFAGRAARFCIDFPHLPSPASVCVWPSMVDVAGLALGSSRIAITSVAGGFPSSQTFIEVKMLEVAMAVESGADEVDVVMSVGEMMEGEVDRVAGTLRLIRDELGEDTVMKVIIESGMLKTPGQIRDASLVAMIAGADFVKTSTGKVGVGATPEAVVVMCGAIADFYEKTGRRVGIKVAGGVRTPELASTCYTIVEELLGPEWLTPRLLRIGASGLADALLSAIEGKEVRYFTPAGF